MMVTRPILYSFRRCPYAMRARYALAAAGIVCELREVLLRDKPADMLKASPKGTVPVLIVDQKQIIDESLDVMKWALEQNDPTGLIPDIAEKRAEAFALIDMCDKDFKHHLDRYKYANRYKGADAEHHRGHGALFLKDLNQRLQNHPFLIGEKETIADIAIMPFVRQFRIADPVWFDSEPWNHLSRWLKAYLESPAFQTIMKKYKPWQHGESTKYGESAITSPIFGPVFGPISGSS